MIWDGFFCQFIMYVAYISLAEYMSEPVRGYIDGLVQERCNSSALAMELRLSYFLH